MSAFGAMTSHAKGLIITALGVAFVLPDALFARLIGAPALTIVFWRALTSGLAVGAFVLAFSGPSAFKGLARVGWPVLIYGAGIALSGVLFIGAVGHTSVANVVLIIAAMPLITAALARMFLGERIGRRVGVTMAVVFAGLALVAAGSASEAPARLVGDAMALGVPLAYGAALSAARSVRAVSLVPAIPLASLALAGVLLLLGVSPRVPGAQWPLLVVHGGVFVAAATMLLATGPRFLPAPEVALLVLGETVLTPLLVWAVLDEVPPPLTLLGGAVVLGALVVSNLLVLWRNPR